MERHFEDFVHICKSSGEDPNEHYHIAEVVVLPEHQGRGLVPRIFEKLESYAQGIGFMFVSLSTESHEHHSLKPKGYQGFDPIWRKLGYTKTDMVIHFSWETIQPKGPSKMEVHAMSYWMKHLDKNKS
jgi:ribosomal protein S18 acetylase RimI-like enzyme